jgi:hypothetical protein
MSENGYPQFIARYAAVWKKESVLVGQWMRRAGGVRRRHHHCRGGMAENPKVDVVLPTMTVEDHLDLVSSRDRTIQIRYLGRGHTGGDLVVYLLRRI